MHHLTETEVHRLAKSINMLCVIGLVVLNSHQPSMILEVEAVVVWFWGYEPTRWLLENLLHMSHKYNFFD